MIGRYIARPGTEPEDVYPPPHLRPIQIGVDVGKMTDPTALAVAELDHRGGDRPDFAIVKLERLALGTSYPQIADRLVEVVRNLRRIEFEASKRYLFDRDNYLGDNMASRETRSIEMLIDATGVGRPLIDMIGEPLKAHDVRVRAVTFRAGEALVRNGSEWSMGKGYMVSRLQVVLQSGRVLIPAHHPYAKAIRDEIHAYEIHLGEQGKATYGGRQGKHDDMVTALGLAVLIDGRVPARAITAEDWDLFVNGEYSAYWRPEMGSVNNW